MRNWTGRLCVAVAFLGAWLAGTNSAVAADEPATVTISGNAWAFVLTGTTSGLEGATIGIAEHPEITTVSGPDGAWSLEVPNHESITPFATAPGRYAVYDQTFFTRDRDLNQVNFQMPPQGIAEAFAQIVGASMNGEPGSKVLDQCAIVSTVFQKEGRNFTNFNDFLAFAPHGIEGATAEAFDPDGQSIGPPVYFDSHVIPTPSLTSASRDGGMVWDSLPAGVYTVQAYDDTARFSSFRATCEPGRLVNASPPWGTYEMARTEEPNPAVLAPDEPVITPADESLDASVVSAKVVKKGARKRQLIVKIRAGEPVTAVLTASQGKRKVRSGKKSVPVTTRKITVSITGKFRSGSLSLNVSLADAAGNKGSHQSILFVPAIRKKH